MYSWYSFREIFESYRAKDIVFLAQMKEEVHFLATLCMMDPSLLYMLYSDATYVYSVFRLTKAFMFSTIYSNLTVAN